MNVDLECIGIIVVLFGIVLVEFYNNKMEYLMSCLFVFLVFVLLFVGVVEFFVFKLFSVFIVEV